MDAFYAAVETLENPSLKGKPLAVGSMSMIATVSYEARKFGVRAAMPGFIVCKLCPGLVFVPPNFERYTHYCELTRKVFQRYDPNFIATSLDEAYLNITNVCIERGITGEEVATELRSAIHQETGLTCSAGVAPNRMIAKGLVFPGSILKQEMTRRSIIQGVTQEAMGHKQGLCFQRVY